MINEGDAIIYKEWIFVIKIYCVYLFVVVLT